MGALQVHLLLLLLEPAAVFPDGRAVPRHKYITSWFLDLARKIDIFSSLS